MPYRLLIAIAVGLAAFVASANEAVPAVPTFSKDIAPLVHANCSACHREGEAAPFELLTYADVKKRSRLIADVTAKRYMPPWKPVVGEFVGQRHLTPPQIDLFKRWHDAGAPEGDPTQAPKPPTFPSGWALGQPDLIVKMPEPFEVPADGRDIYRCFVIPVQVPAGKYIRAVEYRPGNRRVVHHAVLTMVGKNEAARRMKKDGDATGPGWRSGLAAPGERLPGPLGVWVPGIDVWPMPDGLSVAWPKDVELVLQLHLHPIGKKEVEQSTVGLFFTDTPPKAKVGVALLFNKDVNIAPGDKNYTLHSTHTVKDDVDVIGLFPHMHLLGKTVTATATLPDGTKRPLLRIDDWDFNWQGYYQYATPLRLPAGTRLDATFTFDNSADNPRNPSSPPKRVKFGEQTEDEMGALVLDVVPVKKR